MKQIEFDKIIVSPDGADSDIARKVIGAWPDVKTVTANGADNGKFEFSDDPVGDGKQVLYLAPNKGKFLRKCPGTMGLVCCNYWVIDLAEGCAIDCSYCILQGYLNDYRIRLATNLDDLMAEIDCELANKSGPIRIGTGELSDSLMFGSALGLEKDLIEFIRLRPQATLELKTKTDNVDTLLELEPAENVVIAWSLNTPLVVGADEKGSATLDERLTAVAKATKAGWNVAFHFDPIIYQPDWQDEYRKVIDKMFQAANNNIKWISLGAFRYHPSLKPVIRERFPESDILNAEFVLCPDNKMRYVKPIRQELFKTIKGYIDAIAPATPVYLCMEGLEMWEAVFGGSPSKVCALGEVFG